MKRLLLLSALLLLGTFAFGQDVSKQNERKRRIEEEISYIDNQLKAITGRQKATTDQLQLIRKRVANRKSLISDLDHRIAVINDSLTAKQREINRLQKELDTLETYSHKLIYNTYKNRDTKFWFMYILASEDIGQGYRRFAFFRNLASEVSVQAGRIREKLEMKSLSPTQEKDLNTWLEQGFGEEAIAIAADRTVTNTGSLKWGYLRKILQSWHEKNLHSPAEIREKDPPRASRSLSPASQPRAQKPLSPDEWDSILNMI